MVFLIALLAGSSVVLLTFAVAQALPARSRAVTQRLSELRRYNPDPFRIEERRRRSERAEQLRELLTALGNRLSKERLEDADTRSYLIQAGFRTSTAPAIYWGTRVALAAFLSISLLAMGAAAGTHPARLFIATGMGLAVGWLGPAFYVRRKRQQRMLRLQRALPDALDLLVVCVEAGLGLNQAIVRVSEEMRNVSEELSDEFNMVNLEFRTGVEREDALRGLADRTGVDDIRALVTILVQTEKFGTSVATALRTQADTMRVIRRQRAEEMAAKATIKIVPPLVFCIFPALFIVIIGPPGIQILHFMAEMKR